MMRISDLIEMGQKRFPNVKPCRSNLIVYEQKDGKYEIAQACAVGFALLGLTEDGDHLAKRYITTAKAVSILQRNGITTKQIRQLWVINDHEGLKNAKEYAKTIQFDSPSEMRNKFIEHMGGDDDAE